MELDKETYLRLEKIVGVKNISADPVITVNYAYSFGSETLCDKFGLPRSHFAYAPIAVVLPGSTDEVQAVVKAVHEMGLKFKAQSTGLGPWNNVSGEDSVIIDLRRMDKIRKIDAKNMYAVIEPYVTGATLQAELLKLDMNTHMPGAGPQVSPLASSTSMFGPGFTSDVTGYSERNVLGVEWVLPDGELVKLGTLGLENEPEWYCGDGPGFSLRGVMRGASGAKGGLGVFTACAVKCYPYPCEPKWKITGISPDYEFEMPKFMQFHIINYRNFDDIKEALYQFSQEEIGFMVNYSSGLALAAIFSRDRGDLIKTAGKYGILKKPVCLLITARTQREFEYKEKVVQTIVEATNGKDFVKKETLVPRSQCYVEALRSMLGLHAFMASGAFTSAFGGMDSIGVTITMAELNIPVKMEYVNKKLLANDGGEGIWLQTYEYGHYAHAEMPAMYDKLNPASKAAVLEYTMRTNQLIYEKALNVPFAVDGDAMHDYWGPRTCNYQVWLRKLKEAFDPDNNSDAGFYISPEAALKEKKEQHGA
ncbi:MAG: FAD-binding oxidoreductase [Candidatus Helarchaeota archaeon]|nr:FAD-binding oxidoreductase [Candidatus Helarchaeota archaeon]